MVLLQKCSVPTLVAPGVRPSSSLPLRATSPLKNRVGGLRSSPSGRPLGALRSSRKTATGYARINYETASGRAYFLSRDPIEIEGGINLYAYVGNNPLIYLDPSGLVSADCAAAIAKFGNDLLFAATQLGRYNPVTDLLGSSYSSRSRKPTTPGGHAVNLLDLFNGLENDIDDITAKCTDDPPCPPPAPDPNAGNIAAGAAAIGGASALLSRILSLLKVL